jgi:hypothetical protein
LVNTSNQAKSNVQFTFQTNHNLNGLVSIRDMFNDNNIVQAQTNNGLYSISVDMLPYQTRIIHLFPVPTGLGETNFETNFQLYPNPAKNELTISLNYLKEPLKMEIYNLQGALVMDKTLVQAINKIELDIPNGIYFVKLVSENGQTISKKLLIEH